MPNIGQIVSIEPVQTSAPQPTVTTAVARIDAGQPVGLAELRDDLAERFLQQEARDARAGVDRGEDEQRLEHDGEVVPVFDQPSTCTRIDEAALACVEDDATCRRPA